METREILNKSIQKHQEAIDEAKKELAKLEVTYSIGDRFISRSGSKYMIVGAQAGDVLMASMGTGFSHTKPVKYEYDENCNAFGTATFDRLSPTHLIRYWDNRKGVKV